MSSLKKLKFDMMIVSELKRAIEIQLGYQIDSISACRRLQHDFKLKGIFVSYTTFSRLFGLASLKVLPRQSTLNELASFLGYESIEEFSSAQNDLATQSHLMVSNRIELDVLLSQNQVCEAVDHLLTLQSINTKAFLYNTQLVCLRLLNDKDPKNLMYFLKHEKEAIDVFQHFVYEDDPNQNYQRSLEKLCASHFQDEALRNFSLLYASRKNLLRGGRETETHLDESAHFHLLSRQAEISILSKKLSNSKILDQTNNILFLVNKSRDLEFKFAWVGRWCRGLLFTEQENTLKNHNEWKKTCVILVLSDSLNTEFQTIIAVFLMRVYGYHCPMDFMFKDTWDNSKIESKLLLALGFNNTKAFNAYKGILGYR